jgi:sugar lactone lactonase YvrE
MKSEVLCCLLLWAVVEACSAETQTGAYLFSTLAGVSGTNGSADGTNAAALFNFPGSLALDPSGNLYVSDIFNNTIRKLTPVGTDWVVTTIAGQAGNPGSADGTNGSALFDRPNGLAVDPAGHVFVADHYNHTIRKMTASGTNWIVTTIAGLAGVTGSADGTNADARFWSPTGVAIGTNHHLYVTDTANFTVREIIPAGTNWVVSTIAGVALNFGFADGTNGDAQFDYPYGITADSAGRLYVVDWGNNALREVVAIGTNWVVSTIAGVSGLMGSADGPGSVATFNEPADICVDHSGNLYVTDQSNNTIRKLIPSGTNWAVSTIGGVASPQGGNADGLGTAARFNYPWGIAVDSGGTLYVADHGNQTIRSGVFLPALQISVGAAQIVLSWPAAAGAYVPETSSALEAVAFWSLLSQAPVTNGANVSVMDQPRSAPAFYRLQKVQVSQSP